MFGRYLGYLDHGDPLYAYLLDSICPQLGVHEAGLRFRVFRLSETNTIFVYEEKYCRFTLVGKFYTGRQGLNASQAPQSAEHEYRNLCYARDMGFTSSKHYIVKPLGFNPGINNVLVLEYLTGESLSGILDAALYQGQTTRLYRKLTRLAHFMTALHNRSAMHLRVDFERNIEYLGRLLTYLGQQGKLCRDQIKEFQHLGRQWRALPAMWEDCQVIVHGDATPSNFLFSRERKVMAIDLERMSTNDRVYDVGRLCAELKHAFFRATGSRHADEPFIGHFLWEYARHFPDHKVTFKALGKRIPFYLGINLLRIARNHWIDDTYRSRLIHEAKKNLRAWS